jgi:hypothetical protein
MRTKAHKFEAVVVRLAIDENALCANMTETSCVTAISEGGREKTQHGNGKRLGSSGRSVPGIIGFGIA